MSQITPIYTEGDDYGKPYIEISSQIRRLFVETGFGYLEIASSRGGYVEGTLNASFKHYGFNRDGEPIGRIVEDYIPPNPNVKTVELKIANAPSRIHSTGKASYKISLRILFPDKVLYNDFMFYSGNTFKFYDERGSVFLGALEGNIDSKRSEGGGVYEVKISLLCIKKDSDDTLEDVKYTDLEDKALIKVDLVLAAAYGGNLNFKYYNSGGLVIERNVQVNSYEESTVTMKRIKNALYYAGFVDYFELVYTGTTIEFRPRDNSYINGVDNPIVVIGTPNLPGTLTATVTNMLGNHWAKEYIENASRAGIAATVDVYGNSVYVFEPNRSCSRAEAITFLNRMRRYLERAVRG